MDIQISCIMRDGADADRRIDGFGGIHDDKRWDLSIDQLIQWISEGHTFFTNVGGYRANVVVKKHPQSGRLYVTTEGDGFPPNNLLALPECP